MLLSIIALADLLNLNDDYLKTIAAIEKFGGVHRRFAFAGKTKNGARVYDDYAHNVEKIASIISTAQEIAGRRVFAIFQPHGYKAFKFIKNDLFYGLEDVLRKDDRFIFVPVYYAGGTTSFSPKASDVCEEYVSKSAEKDRYLMFDPRMKVAEYLDVAASENDVIMIIGARDESLSLWAKSLVDG